jgi:hypothetical protein
MILYTIFFTEVDLNAGKRFVREVAHVCWRQHFVTALMLTCLLMATIFLDYVNRQFLPILEEAGAEPKQS